MSSRILQGDVFDMLPTIAPGSVDCVVSSPPYWMLRSYLPKDHPLKSRELGSEKTPGEFVARMVEVFRLVRDCMADHATCWLNMGDSYSANGWECRREKQRIGDGSMNPDERKRGDGYGIAEHNLCLIPQRLAIALQDDGWLVRSVVIWHKPAPMPASVAGWRWMRCRVKVAERSIRDTKSNNSSRNGDARQKGHPSDPNAQFADCPGCPKCEPNGGLVLRRGSWRPTSSWEPILMLAKGPGYYADGEAVKTAAKTATVSRDKYTRILDDPDEQFAVKHDHETTSAAGANLRDVWTIAAEPLAEKHYAAFPTELVRLCLKAGTSEKGYCRECGKPWARVVETTPVGTWHDHSDDDHRGNRQETHRRNGDGYVAGWEPAKTLGWRPTCQHETEPRPALVLDPFAGSGRVGVCAQRMFLDFVGVELNPTYAEMSERILRDDCPLFSDFA